MPLHRAVDRIPADPVAVARVRRLRPPPAHPAGWVPDLGIGPRHGVQDDGPAETHWDDDDLWVPDEERDDAAGTHPTHPLLAELAEPAASADLAEPAEPAEKADSGDEPDLPRATRISRGRWHRLAETWVPEPMRDARVDPGRRGALILSVVAALAAVVAAVGVWRDRPEPRPIQPVVAAPLTDTVGLTGDPSVVRGAPAGGGSKAAGPSTAAAARAAGTTSGPPSTSSGPAVIAVSVTGLVRTPGLVHLPAGSRVADAIAAAGGVASRGSITGLNLAAPLSDGDSVVIGGAAEGTPSGTGPVGAQRPSAGESGGRHAEPTSGGGGRGTLINLNTADASTLEQLPGVGPVMAANIVAWRDGNGSFSSVEQLQEVSGIGPTRFAQLAPLVTVG